MGKAGALIWCVVGACGRIGFEPLGGDGDLDGDSLPILSCLDVASTCGPSGTSPCCGSPLVPGGTFYRGYDVGTDNAFTDMSYPATVSDFRLDTYEVTVGRFRRFVNAGMGTQASPPAAGAGARTLNALASQGGWDVSWNASLRADTAALVAALNCGTPHSWTDTPGGNETLPMNCITWFEAFAFCAWDGGFLPTVAEWNYAVAGGTEQRAYPWSTPASSLVIDCTYVNFALCVNSPTRVGSYSPKGDSKWRQADLGGNLWEWTLDYSEAFYGNPCTDCANLTPNPLGRELRGGVFFDDMGTIRGASRAVSIPDGVDVGTGVRCARAP